MGGILAFNNPNAHWCSDDKEGLNAQLVIKIINVPFYITHYSIRSHPSTQHYMRAWTLEGSNDNVKYEMIHNMPENNDLISNKIGQYPVNAKRKGYKYFRIKQTIKTISNLASMRISGLDFYGSFMGKQANSCRNTRKDSIYLLAFVFVSLS